MAINTVIATIQMRHGMYTDFDPSQMTQGEWAVATDNQHVYMCIRPGLCVRMATYEAFEKDVAAAMERFNEVLEECQDIKSETEAIKAAIEIIQSEVQENKLVIEQYKEDTENFYRLAKSWAVGETGSRYGEDTDNSKYYSEQSKRYADMAENSVNTLQPNFFVDFSTGNLLYNGGKYDFKINEQGDLLWRMVI